jgi:hypothetical protein
MSVSLAKMGVVVVRGVMISPEAFGHYDHIMSKGICLGFQVKTTIMMCFGA